MAGITNVLRPTLDEVNELFWNQNAKYGTFYKRIFKAAELGLIGLDTESNLEVIRNVRNVFAHSMIDLTFATPEISAACDRLTISNDAQFFIDQENERKTRYRYCYACDAVFRGLLAYASAQWLTFGPAQKPSQPILP